MPNSIAAFAAGLKWPVIANSVVFTLSVDGHFNPRRDIKKVQFLFGPKLVAVPAAAAVVPAPSTSLALVSLVTAMFLGKLTWRRRAPCRD